MVIRKRDSRDTWAVDWQFLLFFIFDVGLKTNGPPNLHIINCTAWEEGQFHIPVYQHDLEVLFQFLEEEEDEETQITLEDAQVE